MNFICKCKFVFVLLFVFCTTVLAQSFVPLPIADSIIVKNLNVKNTEIRDLLQGMAVQYGLNLFLAPDVRGPVTVNFNNQPLKDAFSQLPLRDFAGFVNRRLAVSALTLPVAADSAGLRPDAITSYVSMASAAGVEA